MCERLLERFRAAKFPPAAGETTITQPVAFGRLPARRGLIACGGASALA